MPIFGTFNFDMEPIYVDLGNSLGAYRIQPGKPPYIVLHNKLKDNQDPTSQLVYQTLLDFHHSLPPAYFLFPLTQFYEDLVPAEVEPEVIIFARAGRRWGYPAPYPERFRLIG
jgi:hypothetical protein